MKSISTIKPVIKENTECSIVKACATFIDLKIGVLLDHDASLMHPLLLALRTCLATFQAGDNVRSTPTSSALTLVSH